MLWTGKTAILRKRVSFLQVKYYNIAFESLVHKADACKYVDESFVFYNSLLWVLTMVEYSTAI